MNEKYPLPSIGISRHCKEPLSLNVKNNYENSSLNPCAEKYKKRSWMFGNPKNSRVLSYSHIQATLGHQV